MNLASLPLFSDPLPRTLDAIERALGISFARATVERGSVRIDNPSSLVESVAVGFGIGIMHNPTTVEGYRLWSIDYCYARFADGNDVEGVLASRAAPVAVTDPQGSQWRKYGEILVRDGLLSWYGKLPDWAVHGVGSDARVLALRELAQAARAGTLQQRAFPPEAGIVATRDNFDVPCLELVPAMPAPDLVSAFGLGAVVGLHYYPCDGEANAWIEEIVEDNGEKLWHQRPQLGPWHLEARLDRVASGRRITYDGGAEVTDKDVVRYLAFKRGTARSRESDRLRFGFVTGERADEIVDIGRDCVTGASLPHALFPPGATRFCWREYDVEKNWDFLGAVASAMGDGMIYSIAPPEWHAAGVGVFEIPVHLGRKSDFVELCATRAAHGEPHVQWLFGKSRMWGAVFDRAANLIVVGTSRRMYHFEEAWGFREANVRFSDVLVRLPQYAEQLRATYAAGSWD